MENMQDVICTTVTWFGKPVTPVSYRDNLLGCTLQDKMYKESNSTFESRMIEEYKQLGDRLGKLNIALNKDGFKEKVGEKQYNLMCAQDRAMTEYWNILRDRMTDLGIKFEE